MDRAVGFGTSAGRCVLAKWFNHRLCSTDHQFTVERVAQLAVVVVVAVTGFPEGSA